jgi:dienelactone hydrolase
LVTAKSIAPNFTALKAVLGSYKGIMVSAQEKTLVHDNITLTLAFENAALPFIVRFNHEGEIDDFLLDQNVKSVGYTLPQYANEQLYTDQEIVVGSGQWALPGTLSTPNDEKLHPAVILVHGSGPGDRDESLYALKPFRDLASGLASEGIAVLRYEKRTREYPAQFSALPNVTLKDEAEDDVFAAIELLRSTKGVDPNQIYVLGHSQGGFMMPRLLELDKSKQIAGSILMSAPAGTFYDIFEKQITDQVNLKQAPQQALDYYKTQFAMIRANEQPPKEFALTPTSWWFDLRGYEPSQQAKTQTGKLLVLQGARDFQVTSDNLDTWKHDLKDRIDVTYHLYPKLNHMYTEGEGGLSTAQEYTKLGNIPDYVINDIVNWVKNTTP